MSDGVEAVRRLELPPPIEVPWTMKLLESAESGIDALDHGRLHLWIVGNFEFFLAQGPLT